MLRAVVYFLIVAVLWAAFIRPWLRTKPWAAWFFDLIEPVERWLWLKSESIFLARVLQLVGGVLVLLANFDTNTLDTLMLLAPMLPETWQAHAQLVVKLMPLVVNLAGFILEWMRRDVTKPLPVVAMRTDASVDAKIAAAEAELAAKQAVEAIKTDQQERGVT